MSNRTMSGKQISKVNNEDTNVSGNIIVSGIPIAWTSTPFGVVFSFSNCQEVINRNGNLFVRLDPNDFVEVRAEDVNVEHGEKNNEEIIEEEKIETKVGKRRRVQTYHPVTDPNLRRCGKCHVIKPNNKFERQDTTRDESLTENCVDCRVKSSKKEKEKRAEAKKCKQLEANQRLQIKK